MTREQFADLVIQALTKTGEYLFTDQVITYKDQNSVNQNYRGNVQLALKLKIADLAKDGAFYPKTKITRSVAAAWVDKGMKVVADLKGNTAPNTAPQQRQHSSTRCRSTG